jgi:hypothetical protein
MQNKKVVKKDVVADVSIFAGFPYLMDRDWRLTVLGLFNPRIAEALEDVMASDELFSDKKRFRDGNLQRDWVEETGVTLTE